MYYCTNCSTTPNIHLQEYSSHRSFNSTEFVTTNLILNMPAQPFSGCWKQGIACSAYTYMTPFNSVFWPEHAMITPAQVLQDKWDVSSTNLLDHLEMKEDILEQLQWEQFWMIKLDTITPKVLNLKWELQLNIFFVIPLSETSKKLVKIAKGRFSLCIFEKDIYHNI